MRKSGSVLIDLVFALLIITLLSALLFLLSGRIIKNAEITNEIRNGVELLMTDTVCIIKIRDIVKVENKKGRSEWDKDVWLVLTILEDEESSKLFNSPENGEFRARIQERCMEKFPKGKGTRIFITGVKTQIDEKALEEDKWIEEIGAERVVDIGKTGKKFWVEYENENGMIVKRVVKQPLTLQKLSVLING